jgi:glycosyltransferase involved in cell wall biosynthesis
MRKISIVMAYKNRLNQLKITLETIALTRFKNFEIIIVDDGSDVDKRSSLLSNDYDMDIKNVYLKNRKGINPCVVFNVGFSLVSGDVILIQNPECFHVGDVISYASRKCGKNRYITFPCYSINKEMTEKNYNCSVPEILDNIYPLHEKRNGKTDGKGWYNHVNYRPTYFHFCAAIDREDLISLGGFDERYAEGIAFDDREFIERIKWKGINVEIAPMDTFVVHQYHNYIKYKKTDLFIKNKKIFYTETLKHKKWRLTP